jgi:rhamnosyltransferase
MHTHTPKTCAVLVLYRPCQARLVAVLQALVSQVEHLLLVDNTPDPDKQPLPLPAKNCTVLTNRDNIGLAKAQNQGIQWALAQGYPHILLMDQDSIAAPDMVANLHHAACQLRQQGVRLAAVGPRYGRNQQTASRFIRLGRFRYDYLDNSAGPTPACSFLIASGTLIDSHVLRDVGLMDETLFIDHIDTEWCFRAQSRGYVLHGVNNALMRHALGERQITLWWGRERHLALHQPFRLYYIFRNSILLYRRHYLPRRWKLFDLKRLLIFPWLYLLFSDQRKQSLYCMGQGILHGLQQRGGKWGA